MSKPSNNLVVTLAYDNLCTFEFAIGVEIFGLDRPEAGPDWYRFGVATLETGPIRIAGGLSVVIDGGLQRLDEAGTILIPGWRNIEETPPPELIEALISAHARGARLMSICSGVFVLAATGLLDGKRATTHWRYVDRLARDYPSISVDSDSLYVDEGRVLTSAGSAAGLDLCLHLVRRDYGPSVANLVARRLVVPPHRSGNQSQRVDRPVPKRETDRLAAVLDWMRKNLDKPHSVEALAEQAAMSPRTFLRRFKSATGSSPVSWLLGERITRACELLERTTASVDEIAELSGFGSAGALRHQFRKRLNINPATYRSSKRYSDPSRSTVDRDATSTDRASNNNETKLEEATEYAS